jgi:hypothetical protein
VSGSFLFLFFRPGWTDGPYYPRAIGRLRVSGAFHQASRAMISFSDLVRLVIAVTRDGFTYLLHLGNEIDHTAIFVGEITERQGYPGW